MASGPCHAMPFHSPRRICSKFLLQLVTMPSTDSYFQRLAGYIKQTTGPFRLETDLQWYTLIACTSDCVSVQIRKYYKFYNEN